MELDFPEQAFIPGSAICHLVFESIKVLAWRIIRRLLIAGHY